MRSQVYLDRAAVFLSLWACVDRGASVRFGDDPLDCQSAANEYSDRARIRLVRIPPRGRTSLRSAQPSPDGVDSIRWAGPRILDGDYLMRTGRWSHGEEFGTAEIINENDDPPHWSPILSSREFTRERYGRLHDLMQNDTSLDEAKLLLDAAAPGRADLSDRATLAWIPVTLRYFALGAQYCDFNVAVNGIAIGSVRTSSRARETRSDKIVVGDVELRRGENEVTIQLLKGVSPGDQSGGCSVGVDGFEFRPIK